LDGPHSGQSILKQPWGVFVLPFGFYLVKLLHMNSGEERLGQLVKVFRAQFRSHAVEVQDEELGDLGLQEVEVILVGEVGFVRGLREF